LRDFHYPLNDASPGRECGAVTREHSGNGAGVKTARPWVKITRHFMKHPATVDERLPAPG
jgi:hypothetical protein